MTKLMAQLKLQPTPEQHAALLTTMQTVNAACNQMSDAAWQTKTFKQFPLHRLCYADIKTTFGLTAQVVVRAIAKVADAYKLDRRTKRAFRSDGAITYDDRILAWNLKQHTVSIWTTSGRQTIPFVAGERQMELLHTRRGETDLAYVNGSFYLLATCDVETPEPIDVDGVLGVDLGVTNIATTSDSDSMSGSHIKNVRYRHRHLRQKLQRKGTRGAKRRLKNLSGKERRFANHTNHTISKRLVQRAKCTKRAIALEDLTAIRSRMKARRAQRAVLHSWAFHQLRQHIAYKAALSGVPVCVVDPRNTSRECSHCGHIDKASRKTQSLFLCTSCGCTLNADVNAACIIASRAVVGQPDYSVQPSVVSG
jgi:putative transposase